MSKGPMTHDDVGEAAPETAAEPAEEAKVAPDPSPASAPPSVQEAQPEEALPYQTGSLPDGRPLFGCPFCRLDNMKTSEAIAAHVAEQHRRGGTAVQKGV